jgi:8-oxo-dGTP pyrophosphatase MutT (NUDIX family)
MEVSQTKERRRGAGILAYSVGKRGEIHFLVQQTHSGRKQGQLMDLGGGVNDDETPEEGAQREWWEEGGRLFTSREQLRDYFVASQTWGGLRVERKKRGWTLFFVRVPSWDLAAANAAPVAAGSKRREYFWVSPHELLEAADSGEPGAALEAREGQRPRVAWQRLRRKRRALRRAVETLCRREEALARIG